MSKKIIGYIGIGAAIVVVLVLVYFFVTKGYSGKGTGIAPIPQSPASTSTTGGADQETGDVTPNNISLVVASPKDGATLSSTHPVLKYL
jgi:hypothetical protein